MMRVQYLLLAACAAWLVGGAISQNVRGAEVDVQGGGVHVQAGPVQVQVGTPAAVHAAEDGNVMRASNLIGLRIRGADNQELGRIEDLVIAPTGRVRYAVVSFAGRTAGQPTEKFLTIPWQRIELVSKAPAAAGVAEERFAVINVPREVLQKAPGFDRNRWPDFAQRGWNTTIDRYYETQREANRPAPPRERR